VSPAADVGAPGGQVAGDLRQDDASSIELDNAERLAPYVPRLALEWLEDSPSAVHRHIAGTLLFVDVSGFTALTERLAARGKVGAEEITDVIGSVFTEMLGVAARYGADLLKWGGDASLLFFTEPASAPRACRAAMLMSRTMSRIGRLRTSAGRVSLGVSIGAHSGGFDFYLLGGRHRELVVTGPAATTTARMEAIAEAGEVLVSPATASRLDSGCLGGLKQEGLLLAEAPEVAESRPQTVPALRGIDVELLLPTDTRAHLLGGGEQAEHRQATIAFVEFSGVDALSEDKGAETVGAFLDPLVRSAEEAADRHGASFHGTDIGPDGGKIILLGGVPVLRGNDAERVLRAAREIVSSHPVTSPIGLRVGVNAGRVFVFSHDTGLGNRRIFSITGDAVNLAARVMGHATPRQVLATDTVLSRARNPFETEAVPPFHVKGKAEPVLAAAVGAPRHDLALNISEDLPFVGRDEELGELLALGGAAASGSGGVVEIVGAPGVGKSRLVSEAIGRWDLLTLRVACEEYGSSTPYLAFRHIFRRLLGGAADAANDDVAGELRAVVAAHLPDLEPFLPLLADIVGVSMPSTPEVDDLEPRFRRVRLEYCAVRLLGVFVKGSSALVLEDAHAMDEASASLLGRLVGELGTLPLLVVLTRGPGTAVGLPEGSAHPVIELHPLEEEAAARLAGSGSVLSPAQVAAIVERANGNPLFLRELLRAGVESTGLEGLPESLEPLLAAQIDLLSPSDRQVLRAAAVLGGHFDSGLLPELLDDGFILDDAVWARLSPYVAPTADGRRFTHGLMRDAAYEGLSFKRRKQLHGRAARAIENRTTAPEAAADLLSLHWLHAEGYDKAWSYSCLAGERARVLWANAEAATFFERALEAAKRLRALPRSEVSAVAEALGDTCELTGNYDRSRLAYARARRLGGGEVDRARLLRKTGVLHERRGHYGQALALYTKGRRLVVGSTPEAQAERAELGLASAGICSRQGRYRECTRFATEAALEAARAGHRAGLAHALYLEHMMSVYLGQPEDDLALRALAIFEELGDLVGQGNVLNNLGIGAYYLGTWVTSLEHYEASREARIRAGDVVGAATEENNIAEILSDQGDLEAARPLFESARATWVAAGYRVGVALATSNLGRLEARAGNIARGRALLEEALGDFREIRSPIFVSETEVRLDECLVLEGDFPRAIDYSSELLAGLRGRPGLDQLELTALRLLGTARALADIAARPGEEPAEWSVALDEAVAWATALEARYELALALAVRSELGLLIDGAGPPLSAGRERAEDDDERARALFESLGVARAVITWSSPVSGEPILTPSRSRESPVVPKVAEPLCNPFGV
jgi:class 3 adenylate cyclase/tetratricopeptide (TPR) repeat protein